MLTPIVRTAVDDDGVRKSAIDLYFLGEDGSRFKVAVQHDPYFYIKTTTGNEELVEKQLIQIFGKGENPIKKSEILERDDLEVPNHLSGVKGTLIKLSFDQVSHLTNVRNDIQRRINASRKTSTDVLGKSMAMVFSGHQEKYTREHDDEFDAFANIVEFREYDVPYLMRVCIDLGIRAGQWYSIEQESGSVIVKPDPSLKVPPEAVICAFDIECTKEPLKFPDMEKDEIMMISFMLESQGYLLINGSVVGSNTKNFDGIEDFEFKPSDDFPSTFFECLTYANEQEMLRAWYDFIFLLKPTIFVSFNGDSFDWPYIECRSAKYGLDQQKLLGFQSNYSGEVTGIERCHLDCYKWVKRDSYLPQGSQGLKAVTRAKLGFDPLELDPELMTPYARDNPKELAHYSVSDAVATYHLYKKYVHPFIFSLCTIIPLPPEDVLRKGTGTLCESLLMTRAFEASIICPNKSDKGLIRYHNKMVLESETYDGAKVEALQSGVFRADIPMRFNLTPSMLDTLAQNVERDLDDHAVREGLEYDEASRAEVADEIRKMLIHLRDNPEFTTTPLIYHLDIAAMYPNIILTNRLQPVAIVSQNKECVRCTFNSEENRCQRKLPWYWRGEVYECEKNQQDIIKAQLIAELGDNSNKTEEEKALMFKKALGDYCSKTTGHRTKKTRERREDIVCQRENNFYIRMVRDFRDRRYEYKRLLKDAQQAYRKAVADKANEVTLKEKTAMVVLYDSLQLAHKCILNTFYGYVMRVGARWYSIEMAGIVTTMGAEIITNARQVLDQLGSPLELDTDGIWCCLPSTFPNTFQIKTKSGKKAEIPYPAVMLNADVTANFSNDQYQDIDPETGGYKITTENSIGFEIDGPYKAMILPASKKEGETIKKRYCVYNFNGRIAELKGFELKRRGELKLIKEFQEAIFGTFLKGTTLQECYQEVAKVCNTYLDIITSHGSNISDEQLYFFLTESRSMSKGLAEYEGQKSNSITTARRLGELLGEDMVKDKGLACSFVIARLPVGKPVSERSIPVEVFKLEDDLLRKKYLRSWLKDSSLGQTSLDVRDILDWDYYKERLSSAIMKIVTIPAAFQGVKDIVPRIQHPDWVNNLIRNRESNRSKDVGQMMRQRKIQEERKLEEAGDIEDMDQVERPLSLIRANLAKTTPGKKSFFTPTAHQHKKVSSAQRMALVTQRRSFVVRFPDDETTTVPLWKEQPSEWVKFHKVLWRVQRMNRHRQAVASPAKGESTEKLPTVHETTVRAVARQPSLLRFANVGLSSLNQQSGIFQSMWKILQIAPSTPPIPALRIQNVSSATVSSHIPSIFSPLSTNELTMWLYCVGTVIPIRIKPPKSIIVDSLVPFPSFAPSIKSINHSNSSSLQQEYNTPHKFITSVRRVEAVLPHNIQPHYLFQCTIDPSLDTSGWMMAITRDRNVAKVFESEVSPTFRAITSLGSCCRLKKFTAKTSLDNVFDVSEFEFFSTDTYDYLNPPSNSTKTFSPPKSPPARFSTISQADPTRVQTRHPFPQLDRELPVIYLYSNVVQDASPRALFGLYHNKTHKLVLIGLNTPPRRNFLDEEKRHQREEYEGHPILTSTDGFPSVEFFNENTFPKALSRLSNVISYFMVTNTYVDPSLPIPSKIPHQPQSRSSALILLQSVGISPSSFLSQLPSLATNPLAIVPHNLSDIRPNPIGWHSAIAKLCGRRLLEVGDYIGSTHELARFSSVPLCDSFLSVETTEIAEEELCGVRDLSIEKQDSANFWNSTVAIEISNMGMYDTTCVEFSLSSLAINSVFESVRISEYDDQLGMSFGQTGLEQDTVYGADKAPKQPSLMTDYLRSDIPSFTADGTVSPTQDYSAHSSQYFRKLRDFVSYLYQTILTAPARPDVRQPDVLRKVKMSRVADDLLIHFYRWVSSPSSYLFDPLLLRSVHICMKKVLFHMLLTVTQLGLSVVYASTNRLIINTARRSLKDAEIAIKTMVSTILQKDLFKLIVIEPVQLWRKLIFLDRSNFGGMRPELEEEKQERLARDANTVDIETSRGQSSGDLGNGSEQPGSPLEDVSTLSTLPPMSGTDAENMVQTLWRVDFRFDLVSCFPKSMKSAFEIILKRYLTFHLQLDDDNTYVDTDDEQSDDGMGKDDEEDEVFKLIDHKAQELRKRAEKSRNRKLQKFVREKLQADLITIVKRIRSLAQVDSLDDFEPKPIKPIHWSSSPAVAYVTVICHILSLDKPLTKISQTIKRVVLEMLNTSAFSEETKFVIPSAAIIITNVPCSFCGFPHELDLARDKDLIEGRWNCPICHNPYDQSEIEQILLRALKRRLQTFPTQMTRCALCKAKQTSYLQLRCECQGQFTHTTKKSQILTTISNMTQIAEFYNFGVLLSFIRSISDML
ncbi:putative DNA polymerase epsilon catalytic subunit A [Blattamonas nauphoetae]|uniref:DNA polymerase epsilon catalytic subunit n=1 Tax=Blattamonas nauphoetae TaxID=2049346 RepID=A0ABQ9YF07_9EUKA|nr:putative DNA polymerase epsilon catalytic subunit A [Blattamonas nauphoetae]